MVEKNCGFSNMNDDFAKCIFSHEFTKICTHQNHLHNYDTLLLGSEVVP